MEADDPTLSGFRHLWTTAKSDYVLVAEKDGLHGPFLMRGGKLSYLIIEDDSASRAVIRLMKEAAVRIVGSLDEATLIAKSKRNSDTQSD